ncbi:5-amino-6-(D-ribitylamino)uracil--L-tyrosine 4-hydroxyphenyl transferase CofH [Methanobrevibacter curvatus]
MNLDKKVKEILEYSLDNPISNEDAFYLMKAKERDINAIIATADIVREKVAGNVVTFIENWNINFTNICTGTCGFCSFKKNEKDEDSFFLSPEEVAIIGKKAYNNGAKELCIQGGLHKDIDLFFLEDIVKAVKKECPDVHLHSFSPMEIYYNCKQAELTLEEGLKILKKAGLGTITGTAAEILNDDVRKIICPTKLKTKEWIEVVTTAHEVGLKSTATIMYGHIDTYENRIEHLDTIRKIQYETGGITEFIPLSFVHPKTPIFKKGKSNPGTTGTEDLKIYAISRLMFHDAIKNIQTSWVKLGFKFAQIGLISGCNDLGGTLGEENISKSAGASHGVRTEIKTLEHMVKNIGRTPALRDTLYENINLL